MRVSDKAIILQSIKHGDRKYILKLFTHHHGTITVATAVGKTSAARIKSSSIMPLSLLDVELIVKQNKDIHQLTEAFSYHLFSNIHGSINKLSIAQFMNEIMIKCLKEQGANAHLFEFIETCLKFLNDTTDGYLNLHLYFLVELTKYLGFEPQNNFSANTPFFDCREGTFTSVSLTLPLGLSKQESLLFSEFLKADILHISISNESRKILIDVLLSYYRLHVPGFNEVKSVEVLKEVIAG
jgi:DNA repair protein RecO (recombination protein O)